MHGPQLNPVAHGLGTRQQSPAVLPRRGVWVGCLLVLMCSLFAQLVRPGIWASLFVQGLFLGAALICFRLWARQGSGFVSTFFAKPVSPWGGLSVAAYLVLTLVAAAGTGLVGVLPASFAELVRQYGTQIFGSLSWALVSLVVAPLCEELFFRGLLLGSLIPLWRCGQQGRKAPFPEPLAIYMCALVFLVFHLPPDPQVWRDAWADGGGAVPVHFGAFFLAVWTGLVAQRDLSLRWAVAAHVVANLSAPIWAAVLQILSV